MQRPSRRETDLQGKASWELGGGAGGEAEERERREGGRERGPGCTRRSPPAIGPNWMKFTKPAANSSPPSASSLQKPYLHPEAPTGSGASPFAAPAVAGPGRGRWCWTGGRSAHWEETCLCACAWAYACRGTTRVMSPPCSAIAFGKRSLCLTL